MQRMNEGENTSRQGGKIMKKIVWMLTGIFMLLNCSYAKTFSDVSKIITGGKE